MKVTEYIKKTIGLFLFTLVFILPFLTPFQTYLSIPNEIVTLNDQSPLEIPAMGQNINVKADHQLEVIDSSLFLPKSVGNTHILYDIAGLPIKKVNVSLLEDIQIIPGGQSIGVQLHTMGVLVVGHHLVNGKEKAYSPGEEANVKVGDIILKINDENIRNMKDVKPLVEEAGKNDQPLIFTIKRGKEMIERTLKPVFNEKESEYQIGLYIRDSATGIGTMSFYDPVTKKYGALGHVISDMDTKKPIEIHDGTIVNSYVSSIERGNSGFPGEKKARFNIHENKLGVVTKNSTFGIFGKLTHPVKEHSFSKPMSIGLSHEVKEGSATILTVVEGEEVEEFEVEVVSSVPQKFPATKGIVIRVTDDKLLEKTGGIVQGMSGSPILQDGKIIGAVTHVFVNDPTSGYGVHIEWMLQEAGIEIPYAKDLAS